MAQGTRGRWLRVAATGFGVVLCTGLVGCMNSDKPKDTKVATKQPTQGLPGTPTLPPGNNGTAMNRTPGGTGAYGGTAIGAGGTYGGAGSNLIQTGGVTGPTGSGLGAAGPRGATGQNTGSGSSNFGTNYQQLPPGTPGMMGTPTVPTTGTVQPAGGVGMGAPLDRGAPSGVVNAPPPELLPPAPPGPLGHGPVTGSGYSDPGVGPIALPPTPPLDPIGK
jgi:hypothetical protein